MTTGRPILRGPWNIHRKPGYDPCELFLDPALPSARLRAGMAAIAKETGVPLPAGRDPAGPIPCQGIAWATARRSAGRAAHPIQPPRTTPRLSPACNRHTGHHAGASSGSPLDLHTSRSRYRGRPFTSSYTRARYAPVTPRKNNCTPPKKKRGKDKRCPAGDYGPPNTYFCSSARRCPPSTGAK